MYYKMHLKGLYVMTLKLSSKEHISMDNVSSGTTFHDVKIKLMETVAGKSEAIVFNQSDKMGAAIMEVLESMGYEKEKIDITIAYEYSAPVLEDADDISIRTRVGDTRDWEI